MKKLFGILFTFLLMISSVYAMDMRFVQVTDVNYSESNKDILNGVINDINKQPDVQFVVFTGDNIGKASQGELMSFIKTVKHLKKPYYIVMGDKDVNKRNDLGKKQYAKLLHKNIKKYKPKSPNYVFEKDGVVFIVADGTKDVVTDKVGYYKDTVLEWVDANLCLYSDKNVIILQHFPLVAPIVKENYITYKAEEYLEMIKKHPNVKAVISGHYGVNKEQIQDGVVHISTAPSPSYRIIDIMDYDTPNPTIWSVVKEVKLK